LKKTHNTETPKHKTELSSAQVGCCPDAEPESRRRWRRRRRWLSL